MKIQMIERISEIGMRLIVVLITDFLMRMMRLNEMRSMMRFCGQNSSSEEF
jgi:hypothetical protein